MASPSGAQHELQFGDARACAVEVGGGLRGYTVGDRRVLDGYGVDAMCTSGRGQLLAAWPNRLEDGAYAFEGRRLQVPSRRSGVLPRWLELGLDRLEPELVSARVESNTVELVHRVKGLVTHRHRYRLLAGGALRVENVVELSAGVRDVPRIGVRLVLPPGLEQIAWYGRGPWEAYSDRLASTVVGRFESTVADQYVPYILPQEHGHHPDTRWLTLTDSEGFGLEARGEPTIGFGASHFTAADLSSARHTNELEPRPEVVLSLDHAQRGLGTASCGPDTAERYRLLEPRYSFGYVLTPFPTA